MPRAKKKKLIEKYLEKLNQKEIVRLMLFFGLHNPDSKYIEHTPLIKVESNGIGDVVHVRCIDCGGSVADITDYTAW